MCIRDRVLLAGYLLVGVALPVWSAKRGDKVAREYRQRCV